MNARRITCLGAVLLLAVLAPATASAHAILQRTEPVRGPGLEAPAARVVFIFNEPVEKVFSAVRVHDAEGPPRRGRQRRSPGGAGLAPCGAGGSDVIAVVLTTTGVLTGVAPPTGS